MEYLVMQLEERQLTVAHFAMTRRSTELLGAATVELHENSLTDTLSSIAARITGVARVILCLPPTLFAHRLVSLPFNDLRKVREVLPAQLQGELVLSVEELVIDALPAGDGQFLALWTRKNHVAEVIEQFREAGIEPQVVSSLPFAMALLPGVTGDCAVCYGNTLAFLRGGKLTYFRAFSSDVTLQMITAALSTVTISGGELPPKLCLIGSLANESADADMLPLPVEKVQLPLEYGHLFKNDETFLQLAGLYSIARACHIGVLPDFRRGELAWTAGDARLRKKLLLTGILAAMIILLLFAGKLLQYRAAAADIASLNKSVAVIYHEIFPARVKAVDEISEVKGEIKKLAGVDGPNGFLDILNKLAAAKGSSINGLYEAELDGRALRIKGDARSAQSVNEFKTTLAPLLATVELGEVKNRPDGAVTFTLTGTLKTGEK